MINPQMLKQIRQMQEDIKKVQAEINESTFYGQAGGNVVKVAVKGTKKVESIEIKKLPFDSEYKYQLSLRREGNEMFLYFLGAPEKLLERSLNKDGWEDELEKMTKNGLRVLGTGFKKIKDYNEDLNSLAYDFTFAGLVALKDPLRPDTKEAIKECRRAGIRPILITGDHKLTALAVAEEVGIKTKEAHYKFIKSK